MEAESTDKVFIYTEELEKYAYPEHCPFNSRRAGLTRGKCAGMGLLFGSDVGEVAPIRLSRHEIEAYHARQYIEALIKAQDLHLEHESFSMGIGTPDCPVFKGMYDYAALAAGGTVTGARLILEGGASVVFNPSGGFHHAGRANSAGFCYINDIVLAGMEILKAGKRALFLDVDVHHCDGVEQAFAESSQFMTISIHENGKTLFPGTGFENESGKGAGRGYHVNLPLPVGTYDAAYLRAFNEGALPLIKAFDPDILIIELGMDALAGDPLAHLNLTNNVYVEVIESLQKLNKPILATGGGGYNIDNTVRGWALCWNVLIGNHNDDISMGMGGVMLQNADWTGGLRDRMLISDAGVRSTVDAEISRVLDVVKKDVFPVHGIVS